MKFIGLLTSAGLLFANQVNPTAMPMVQYIITQGGFAVLAAFFGYLLYKQNGDLKEILKENTRATNESTIRQAELATKQAELAAKQREHIDALNNLAKVIEDNSERRRLPRGPGHE
jgi:hypothetical protein